MGRVMGRIMNPTCARLFFLFISVPGNIVGVKEMEKNLDRFIVKYSRKM